MAKTVFPVFMSLDLAFFGLPFPMKTESNCHAGKSPFDSSVIRPDFF
jgi:hypothetical protein